MAMDVVHWDKQIKERDRQIEQVMAPLEARLEHGELLSDEELKKSIPLAIKIPDPRTISDPTQRKQLVMLRHRLYAIQSRQYSLIATREKQGLHDEWAGLSEAINEQGISEDRRKELLEKQERVSAKIRFLEQ